MQTQAKALCKACKCACSLEFYWKLVSLQGKLSHGRSCSHRSILRVGLQAASLVQASHGCLMQVHIHGLAAAAGPGSHTIGALLHASLADSKDDLTPNFEVLAGALQSAHKQQQAAGRVHSTWQGRRVPNHGPLADSGQHLQ